MQRGVEAKPVTENSSDEYESILEVGLTSPTTKLKKVGQGYA